MTESEWLASTDPQAMLAWLTRVIGSTYGGPVERDSMPSDRKLRYLERSSAMKRWCYVEFWWAVHNLIAHPLSQLIWWTSLCGLIGKTTSGEEPDEPAHRAALHDLLVDAGYTDARLLSACLTGCWEGTLAEWMEEGPRVVGLVCVHEKGVRLVDRVPRPLHNSGKFWWWADEYRNDPEIDGPEDLPLEWFPEIEVMPDLTEDGYGREWRPYPTPEAAHLDASRRAVRWAMNEARKRKEGAA